MCARTLSVRLVNALYDGTDVQQQLSERLPPPLKRLAAPAAGLVRQAAVNAVDTAPPAPPGPGALGQCQPGRPRAPRRDPEEEDSDRLIQSSNGQVVLDLNPLVVRLNDQLGLNVILPEGAGTYVIADSDELAAAQTAVAVIDPLSILLIIAVLVLLAAAVYLAAGFRRETLRAIAFSLIVIGVLLLVVRRLVGTALVDALTRRHDPQHGLGGLDPRHEPPARRRRRDPRLRDRPAAGRPAGRPDPVGHMDPRQARPGHARTPRGSSTERSP